jgi:hypothetical protein
MAGDRSISHLCVASHPLWMSPVSGLTEWLKSGSAEPSLHAPVIA